MHAPRPDQVTQLLNRMVTGDSAAAAELLPVVYGELHALAESLMRDQGPAHTLQPTALIHEAWIRLVGDSGREVKNRAHFAALAARAMRSVLVDHARRKRSDKRGGGAERIALDTVVEAFEEGPVDLLALDDALSALTAMDGDLGRVVELRFFAGMSTDETAAVLGISVPTVVRRWRVARMWLWRELNPARS